MGTSLPWMAACFSLKVWFFQGDLPGLPFRQLLRPAEELDREVRRIIHERCQEARDSDDVISMLIRARDQHGGSMTENELVGEVSILFAAAYETNTVALTWTLFLLSQHPEILSRMNWLECLAAMRREWISSIVCRCSIR